MLIGPLGSPPRLGGDLCQLPHLLGDAPTPVGSLHSERDPVGVAGHHRRVDSRPFGQFDEPGSGLAHAPLSQFGPSESPLCVLCGVPGNPFELRRLVFG